MPTEHFQRADKLRRLLKLILDSRLELRSLEQSHQRRAPCLTEDELAKIQGGLRDVLGEDGIAALAEYLFQDQSKASASTSVDQATTSEQALAQAFMPPEWLKQWQRRHPDQPWGFVVMRTTCYDDQERWEQFKAPFQRIVEIPFERVKCVPNVAEAKTKFQIHWVEDPKLDRANTTTLREKYEVLWPKLPPGLSQRVFLCASSDSVASVFDAESPPSTESERWRPSAPYILAAAGDEDPGLDEGHEEREWFRPVFKVAAEVLVDEFWWQIDSDMMPLRRITRSVKSVGEEAGGPHDHLEEIWWSMAPSWERLRRRRQVR